MTEYSETQINLKTLRRVDTNIIEIIDNASQVALYKYEKELEKWEGTDIEGTLFLYRRSLFPYNAFIIVNRMNTTNFVEAITSDMQLQLQEPYLLYKNRNGDIIGIWFYEQKDLCRISKQIQMIALKQASTPRRQGCASESETFVPRGNIQDIMSLLSKAHKKYVKKIPVPETVEDVNNLNSYCEKQFLQKSVAAFEEKKSRLVDRSISYEDTASPRRRFIASGSFDLGTFLNPLGKSENNQSNRTLKVFEEKESNSVNDATASCHVSASKCLSPLFRHDEVASPISDVGVLDESFETTHPEKIPNYRKLQEKKGESAELGNWQVHKVSDLHLTNMKEVLKLHVQENPKILLKLHEAYISGLRSLFYKN